MKRNKKTFVKATMFEKGITGKELAKRTGISEAILSMFINGKYILDQAQQIKIANILNCPIEKLSSQSN